MTKCEAVPFLAEMQCSACLKTPTYHVRVSCLFIAMPVHSVLKRSRRKVRNSCTISVAENCRHNTNQLVPVASCGPARFVAQSFVPGAPRGTACGSGAWIRALSHSALRAPRCLARVTSKTCNTCRAIVSGAARVPLATVLALASGLSALTHLRTPLAGFRLNIEATPVVCLCNPQGHAVSTRILSLQITPSTSANHARESCCCLSRISEDDGSEQTTSHSGCCSSKLRIRVEAR